MFIQWEFLGLQIQETASQVALRELLWGGKGGARLHRSSATKGSSLNIKRLLWIKGKPTCQCRRCKRLKFDPWVAKILWRRKWQPTPVFFPEKSHGQRNLTGYSPWGCKELDATEQTHTHTHTHTHKAAKYQISQVKEFSAFLCMGKIKGFCWRRKWQPTPVFLPGESHGQRSLVGYSPWSHKEVDTTDQITHTHTHTHESLFT